jgi:hypothetical protein
METHGRQDIAEDIDVSRTMGWFASSYPVRLPCFTNNVGELVASVRETLRKVPNEGIGANALLLVQEVLDGRMPKIYFNYQGEYESGIDEATETEEAKNQETADVNGFYLSVSAHVVKRRLEFTVLSKLSDRMPDFESVLIGSLEMVATEIEAGNWKMEPESTEEPVVKETICL